MLDIMIDVCAFLPPQWSGGGESGERTRPLYGRDVEEILGVGRAYLVLNICTTRRMIP